MLADFAEVLSGHSFRSKIDSEASGAVSVVQMKNVVDGQIHWETVIRANVPNIREDRFLRQGDVLFLAKGAHRIAALVERLDHSAICSNHFFVIRVEPESGVLPEFIAWYLNQPPAQRYFERSAQGTGALNVGRELIESFQLPAVSLEKQKKISKFVGALKQKHKLMNALIEQDTRLMKGLANSL